MIDENYNNLNLLNKNFLKRNYIFKLKLFINLKKKKKKLIKSLNLIKNFKKFKNKNYNKYFLNKIIILKKNFFKKIFFYFNKILFKNPNLIHYTTKFKKKYKIIKKKSFYKKKKNIKNHIYISEKLGLKLKLGEKLSGSNFNFINNPLSSLYRALINFMLEIHKKENNYKEIIIPYIIKQKYLLNSGHIPKFNKYLFKIKFYKKKFLIPTSEVSLINLENEIIKIPKKLICYSSCFRNESKSYGKKNKGLIKQKQFDKIELINLTDNKNSFRYLIEVLKSAEKIINYLKLKYRIILINNKNTSITSSKTYDLELYLPSIRNYIEVSSCSNTKDFQSKKIKLKYIIKNNKKYINIINGTGLSIGRVLVSILENNFKKNKILIPKFLRKFLNNKKFLKFK